MKKTLNKTKTLLVALALSMFFPLQVLAQSSSPNYRLEETFFGTGGELDASSPNYRAQQSVGENTTGNTGSTNFQANAGFNTKEEPYLEVSTTGGATDLGDLSPSAASVTTSTFYVRAYLASGYSVLIVSNPPTYGTEQINSLSSQTASSAGTEQFGINLAVNTSPASFGAIPSQSPDSTFGFGYATSNYDDANLYQYIKGDTIARSDKSSGRTNYTISYLYNISTLSPAGEYIFTQDLVVVATY